MMTNVIYIHTHDSGDVFSAYPYDVPTPNVKAFSKDACLFTNAFCASPTCSPSRSVLLTGQYPHSNGMMGLANRGFQLHDYDDHLVSLMNQSGYKTVLCGIQHEYGRYVDHQGGAQKIGYQLDITSDPKMYKEKDLVEWDKDNVIQCKKWLRSEAAKQPFFLSLGFFSTHREYPDVEVGTRGEMPAFLLKEEIVKEDFQGHLQSLKYFDEQFQEVIATLKEQNLYDHSIIILTSDHGIPYPRAKCTLYDAGIKVALMMRVPSVQPRVIDGLVSHVDIAPTLCSLLNLKKNEKYQGVDLSPLFMGEKKSVRKNIFAEVNFHTSYEPIRCIRDERYKYIRYYDESYLKANVSNIDNSVSKDFYVSHGLLKNKAKEGFYDLKNDPYEEHNLMEDVSFESLIQEKKQELLAWQEQSKDYLFDDSLVIQREWIINKKECTDPKSKKTEDFL